MTEQSRLVVLSDEQWAVLGPLIDECRPRGKTEPVALRETIEAIVWRHQNGVDPTATLVAKSFSRGHAAFWRAENHEQRVWAVGMPFSQFAIRARLMAALIGVG